MTMRNRLMGMAALAVLACAALCGVAAADVLQRPGNMNTDPTWVWNWSGSTFGPRGAALVPGLTGYGYTSLTLGTPVVTGSVVGTAGSTSRSYKVSAVAGGLETVPASVTVATGPATLSTTNYVRLTWPVVTGATAYRVYRNVSGTYNRLAEVYVPTCDDKGTVTLDSSKHPLVVGQTGYILATNGTNVTRLIPGVGLSIDNSTGTGHSLELVGDTWTLNGGLTVSYGPITGTFAGNADTATSATTAQGISVTGSNISKVGTKFVSDEVFEADGFRGPLTGDVTGNADTATRAGKLGSTALGIPKIGADGAPSAASGADVAGLITSTNLVTSGTVTSPSIDPGNSPSSYGYLAWTMRPELASASNSTGNGYPQAAKIWVPASITVSIISVCLAAQYLANPTGLNGIAIYNSSGTLVCYTDDQATPWQSPAANANKVISAPITHDAAGNVIASISLTGGPGIWYYGVIVTNGTTAPSFSGNAVGAAAATAIKHAGMAANTYVSGFKASTWTSWQATAGALFNLASTNDERWMALS